MSLVDDLNSEKNRLLDDIQEHEKRIDDINENLDRLYDAERRIAESKDNAEQLCSALDNSIEDWNDWQGENYDKSRDYIESDLADNYKSFISTLDEVDSEICNKINYLESEKCEVGGILGDVQVVIEDIAGQIMDLIDQ